MARAARGDAVATRRRASTDTPRGERHSASASATRIDTKTTPQIATVSHQSCAMCAACRPMGSSACWIAFICPPPGRAPDRGSCGALSPGTPPGSESLRAPPPPVARGPPSSGRRRRAATPGRWGSSPERGHAVRPPLHDGGVDVVGLVAIEPLLVHQRGTHAAAAIRVAAGAVVPMEEPLALRHVVRVAPSNVRVAATAAGLRRWRRGEAR